MSKQFIIADLTANFEGHVSLAPKTGESNFEEKNLFCQKTLKSWDLP